HVPGRIVASGVSDGVGSRRSARTVRLLASRRKSIVCSHCGRRFALRLHLGRHVSAMHKNGGSPASAGKETATKKRSATSRPSKRGRRTGRVRESRKRTKNTAARAVRKKATA